MVESNRKRHLTLTSDLHIYAHPYMYTYMHTHKEQSKFVLDSKITKGYRSQGSHVEKHQAFHKLEISESKLHFPRLQYRSCSLGNSVHIRESHTYI